MSAPAPDPEEDADPPRLMTAGFWVALAFGAACIAAGVAVAWLGTRGAL